MLYCGNVDCFSNSAGPTFTAFLMAGAEVELTLFDGKTVAVKKVAQI